MRNESKNTEILSQNLSALEKRRGLIMSETSLCLELLMSELKKSSTSDPSVREALEMAENYELFSPKKRAVISYVKNNYNDAAFLRFSDLFASTKVSYALSFEDACEQVYNEMCDYCILPIESVLSGKLFSFYSLIEKYDLHIFAVCDIDEASSSKRTRYALLSRKMLVFSENDSKSYFEFSLIKDDSYALHDIIVAANTSGAKLYRIDSIPLPYDDLTFRIYHIFEADREALLSLRFYLEYKYPQLKTVGHYLLIE